MYALAAPGRNVACVAATHTDLKHTMFEGKSGLLAHLHPDLIKSYNASDHKITLVNGSVLRGFSAQKPDRMRGPNFDGAWCDELAAWQYRDAWDQVQLATRVGDHRFILVTTTPKPTRLLIDLHKDPDVVFTHGTPFDNKDNLTPQYFKDLEKAYKGTKLWRQEVLGELLDGIEGALWTHSQLDKCRIDNLPDLQRIVIGVDPSVADGKNTDSTGIVVAGECEEKNYYLLEDATINTNVDEWAQVVIDLYYKYAADRVVAETNNGGDLVESLLRGKDPNVSFKKVHASKGKIVRAEPISALYEQHRVWHHRKHTFYDLEEQMAEYTGDRTESSPDNLDAAVWALTELSQAKQFHRGVIL